jgi:hypothetical protein
MSLLLWELSMRVSTSRKKLVVGPSAYRGLCEHLAKRPSLVEGRDETLSIRWTEDRGTRGNWWVHAEGKEAVDTFLGRDSLARTHAARNG